MECTELVARIHLVRRRKHAKQIQFHSRLCHSECWFYFQWMISFLHFAVRTIYTAIHSHQYMSTSLSTWLLNGYMLVWAWCSVHIRTGHVSCERNSNGIPDMNHWLATHRRRRSRHRRQWTIQKTSICRHRRTGRVLRSRIVAVFTIYGFWMGHAILIEFVIGFFFCCSACRSLVDRNLAVEFISKDLCLLCKSNISRQMPGASLVGEIGEYRGMFVERNIYHILICKVM